MGVVVKYTGRISQGMSQLKEHMKYIGFRSDENKEREVRLENDCSKSLFFNKDKDSKDYKDFLKDIENNKALRHSKSVKAHKIVFSLKEKDFDNYIKHGEGKDYRDLMRSTLDEYSKITGKKLDWIATEHLTEGNKIDGYKKSSHPHCHVVLKGVTENNERVYFRKDDYKLMREIFDKEFEKVCVYENKKEHDFNKSNDMNKSIENDLANSLNKVVKSIEKDIARDQAEKAQERRRLMQEKQGQEQGKERVRERAREK